MVKGVGFGVLVAMGDNGDHVKVLSYSYYLPNPRYFSFTYRG